MDEPSEPKQLADFYNHAGIMIYHGDCREVLPELGAVDAVVTDPPYGLSFMGKGWDRGVPGVEFWTAILAAMKPGAHLLAFGGTRTWHRLCCAIEDAGFEIRDCLMWLYGSGFPKSLDVGKAIDRAAGAEREVVQTIPDRWAGKGNVLQRSTQTERAEVHITTAATAAAKQWDGWGTALKPAWEPIILARKPLVGTVAANVQKHGTGGLNIDGCRVGHDEECRILPDQHGNKPGNFYGQGGRHGETLELKPAGRWPANVIHDGSEEVLAGFPEAGGGFGKRGESPHWGPASRGGGTMETVGYGDNGSAARFFYTAKASKADRGHGNTHPTVKPLALMRYLCRLITPAGGTVLDPFCGSGTTLLAAQAEFCKAIGIEIELESCDRARRRLRQEVLPFEATLDSGGTFDEVAAERMS